MLYIRLTIVVVGDCRKLENTEMYSIQNALAKLVIVSAYG